MNSDLIKFIELCLADGVISEKELEVIYRKAYQLGVDRDECEILIDALRIKSVEGQEIGKTLGKSDNNTIIRVDDLLLAFKSKVETELETCNTKIASLGQELEVLNRSNTKNLEAYDSLLKKLSSNSGDGSTKRMRQLNEKETDELIKKYNLEHLVYFPKIFRDKLHGLNLVLNDLSANNLERLSPDVSIGFVLVTYYENDFKIENIEQWKAKTEVTHKLFKKVSSFEVDGLWFALNGEASDFYSWYGKSLKQSINAIDMKGFRLSLKSISKIKTTISKLRNKIEILSMFDDFIKLNEELFNDISRVELLSEVLNKNSNLLNSIPVDNVKNIARIEQNLARKKTLYVDVLNDVFNVSSPDLLQSIIDLFVNGVNEINSIVYHTLNMLESIHQKDNLKYYRIYEKLDELHVFDSQWEKSLKKELSNVSENLHQLNAKIDALNQSVLRVGRKIVDELGELNQTFNTGLEAVADNLKGIESSVNFNNLLTGVQIYQTYKLNRKVSRLA